MEEPWLEQSYITQLRKWLQSKLVFAAKIVTHSSGIFSNLDISLLVFRLNCLHCAASNQYIRLLPYIYQPFQVSRSCCSDHCGAHSHRVPLSDSLTITIHTLSSVCLVCHTHSIQLKIHSLRIIESTMHYFWILTHDCSNTDTEWHMTLTVTHSVATLTSDSLFQVTDLYL